MPSPGFPQLPARILGTGRYLPRHVVTDADIDRRLGWPAGRCFKKNRVARRHFADGDETSTRMAAAALTDALAAASLDAPALDAIIAVSVLPEQPMPTNAVLVHRALGASRPIVCFDINASCLGFLQALDVAAAMIAAGTCRTIGVVASEVASKGLNWQDADTCTLFGDGAAAVVVGRESSLGSGVIFGSFFETYPEGADHTQIAAGGTRGTS